MSQEYASQKPAGFNNHIKNVAIVGVNGQVGKFIVEALLKKGIFNITALTRTGSSSQAPSGVSVKQINYDDQSTIVSALEGQDALVITMSVRAPPDQEAKLVEAAAAAKVPWILPNEFADDGSDEQLNKDNMYGLGKVATRELIKKLGVSSYVAVATNFWYEYSVSAPGCFGVDIEHKTMTFFDEGKVRVRTTTWPMTGESIARILSLKVLPEDDGDKDVTLSSYKNKVAYVSSFVWDQHELFESVKRVTKTKDSDWKIQSVPVKKFWEENRNKLFSLQHEPFSPMARTAFGLMIYSRCFFPDVKTPGADDAVWVEERKKLGLPEEDLDEFTGVAVKMVEEGYMAKLHGADTKLAQEWIQEVVGKVNAA